MERLRCANCTISTQRLRRHVLTALENREILSLIRQWHPNRSILNIDHVCHECWRSINNALYRTGDVQTPVLGHNQVCVNCGRSLMKARLHRLQRSSERDIHVYNVIAEWILPNQVQPGNLICHPCWMRADQHQYSAPSTSQVSSSIIVEAVDDNEAAVSPPLLPEVIPRPEIPSPPMQLNNIILPNYTRSADTENRCIFLNCEDQHRFIVPLSVRKHLLVEYNYYVPRNCRICRNHLVGDWDTVITTGIQSFTAEYIEDIFDVLKSEDAHLDFANIGEMSDNILYYWTGFSRDQFMDIMSEVPQLSLIKRGNTGLAAYLIKLRTGDSDERLSSLLHTPRRTLEDLMAKVRNILRQHFVPNHVGLGHLTRQNVTERNLLIPNGLFGNPNSTPENRKAIIILDGTYVYIQKSTNYLYQKKTYSLHKYSNLVKPLLIVTTDGYIIDILGPYPATTSDAQILMKELQNADSALRTFFRPGDVFILDRGFRDAIPLLEQCSYCPYIPPSLEQNESQLSTLQANKSRAVTITRWVVEVVNGRYKRDFKIFRQEYFNVASHHLMTDFLCASALINKFHCLITDREDAGDILTIIQRNMHVNNSLADVVFENNLNRRRAQFNSIDANDNNLQDFPRLSLSEMSLICLGSYQIKQARSYYGEHVRANGCYTIEVCREVDDNMLSGLVNDNEWLLRGKIQSRHVSRKIYFVYILINNNLPGREAISQYYCNCIVGKRTVGCCAHIMSIIWYLGWARYQNNIQPPAQFLDEILLCYDSD